MKHEINTDAAAAGAAASAAAFVFTTVFTVVATVAAAEAAPAAEASVSISFLFSFPNQCGCKGFLLAWYKLLAPSRPRRSRYRPAAQRTAQRLKMKRKGSLKVLRRFCEGPLKVL